VVPSQNYSKEMRVSYSKSIS